VPAGRPRLDRPFYQHIRSYWKFLHHWTVWHGQNRILFSEIILSLVSFFILPISLAAKTHPLRLLQRCELRFVSWNKVKVLTLCKPNREFSKAAVLLRQRVQQVSCVTAANSSASKLCYCGRVQQVICVTSAKSPASKLCYCGKEFSKAVVSTRCHIAWLTDSCVCLVNDRTHHITVGSKWSDRGKEMSKMKDRETIIIIIIIIIHSQITFEPPNSTHIYVYQTLWL
jgi:hypothetical protein